MLIPFQRTAHCIIHKYAHKTNSHTVSVTAKKLWHFNRIIKVKKRINCKKKWEGELEREKQMNLKDDKWWVLYNVYKWHNIQAVKLMKLRLNAWHSRLASLCNVHKRFSMILNFSSYTISFLVLQMWHSGEKSRYDWSFSDHWRYTKVRSLMSKGTELINYVLIIFGQNKC